MHSLSDQSQGWIKPILVALIPTLCVGLLVAWFGFKLTGEVNSATEARKVDIEALKANTEIRKAEIEQRKADTEERRITLTEISNKIASAAQQAQKDAFETQRKLGLQSGVNEARRTDLEEKRQKIEAIKLAAEIVRAQNDLIPRVTVECKSTSADLTPKNIYGATTPSNNFAPSKLDIICRYINNGVYRVYLSIIGVELYSGTNKDPVKGALVESTMPRGTNSMPAGAKSSNSFTIEFTELGKSTENKNIRITTKFDTDKNAVDGLRVLGEGIVNDTNLNMLSTLNFGFYFDIN